jgi:lipopolysaccharide/colanic/teichoic acid biosynthesis glycosyltransferase
MKQDADDRGVKRDQLVITGRCHRSEIGLLDLCSTENQSDMLDLEILFATIPVVLFGKGAY